MILDSSIFDSMIPGESCYGVGDSRRFVYGWLQGGAYWRPTVKNAMSQGGGVFWTWDGSSSLLNTNYLLRKNFSRGGPEW